MTEVEIARGTAWLVVAAYGVALTADLRGYSTTFRRRVWTIGALTLAIHVLWTMLAVHDGSLAKAYEHTALRTKEFIGIPLGIGLYINFAMLAIWLADAALWWIGPNWDAMRRWYLWPMHLIFSFLFINAAIVFASGWGRAVGFAALASVVAATLYPKAASNSPPKVD